ncbi:MAG: hypothetical protein RLZZ127_1038 [Planctomycetota bacterium]|jgi:single-stranded-DNA-specific exonuclease
MLTATRPWRCRTAPADVVAELEHDLRISRLVARLLALRGCRDAHAANAYLSKRLQDLHKPESMQGMEAAAARLAKAINGRESILIHGDYDVDGTTSATLLAGFVQACSHRAVAWVPHRRIDGYGLSEASLEAVKAHGASLMVTVDCGIADHGWAARIEAEAGCDVIVTDHHLSQGTLPRCTAVVNPNQPGCPYPDKGLAGVGVAWKLAWATAKLLSGGEKVTERLRSYLLDSLALVAVGTLADCAPLAGENRILVHHGMLALRRTPMPGLRALMDHGRLDEDCSATDIGWKIAPLLNASGRVGSAMDTLRLLGAADHAEAQAALAVVVAENEERRRLTQMLTTDLLAAALRPEHAAKASLVFAGEGWHQGVVGIVASRLVETHHKPAVVIAITDGQGKGSARTIPGISLAEAIDVCRPHLIKGGGHAMAAGLSIAPDQVDAFSAAFEAHVAARMSAGAMAPRTEYDSDASMPELDDDFFARLGDLAPFGTGNPEPVLHLSAVAVAAKPRLFGKEGDHLRAALTGEGGGLRELLAWRGKDLFPAFGTPGTRFDLLVRPQAGTFRGAPQSRLVYVDGRSR